MEFIKVIIAVYFTNFPYLLYNSSNNHGNMAYAGIALGFIDAKNIFWSSTIILLTTIYLNKNLNIYLNYSIILLCIFLYGISFKKIKYLMKFI